MSASKSSREKILESIRTELARDTTISVMNQVPESGRVRSYDHCGSLPKAALVELMAERLREYGAQVEQCRTEQLNEVILTQLSASGRRSFVLPQGFQATLVDARFEFRADHALLPQEIEEVDGVITHASYGVAESGTIILHHSASEGRRVLSLLPDWHLCILQVTDIVQTLPEYFQRIKVAPDLVTLISGPSATADIEMTRVSGVHGPRFLSVILLAEPVAS